MSTSKGKEEQAMAVSDQKQMVFHVLIREAHGNSLAVQQLGLCISSAGGMGSIPRQETRIPQAARCSQKKARRGVWGGQKLKQKQDDIK